MPTTKFWLKVMLWAIGLGAAAGVVAVLFGADQVVNRAMGSCFLIAGVSLVMMKVSRQIDRESTRSSGLLGMGVVLAVALLGMALIWDVHSLIDQALGLRGDSSALFMLQMIGWIMLAGVPSMAFLQMTRAPANRMAGWLGLIVAAVMFVLLLAFSVGDRLVSPRGGVYHLMESGLWLGAMGLLAVGGMSNAARLTDRPWRWLGVVAAATALLMALYGVWMDVSSELGMRLTINLISAAFVVAHANLMLACGIRPQHRWVVLVTIATTLATTVLINLLVHFDLYRSHFDSFPERLTAAGLILSASLTLAVLILTRLNRPVAIERTAEQITHVTLTCPVCRSKQSLPTGAQSACGSCGLRFEIKVAEPRCPQCDYLLFHLRSNACPECGRAIGDPASAAGP